jgi:hypothetical protein
LLGIARYPSNMFLAAFAVPLLATYAIRFIDDRVESDRDAKNILPLIYIGWLLMAVMLREAHTYPWLMTNGRSLGKTGWCA